MNIQHLNEAYAKVGKNFMTPDVLKHTITSDDRIIELSEGTGLDGRPIWGVTEFKYSDGRLETTRRGQMHTSKKSATKHFNILLGAF